VFGLFSDILRRMDEHEWARRLRAGMGGRHLWRLRYKTAIATAVDLLAVGNEMSGAMTDAIMGDASDAVGCLLRMAGELLFAAARLLSEGEHYAGWGFDTVLTQ